MSSRPEHVLLIQIRRLGDILQATPAIRALRRAWPESRLTCLVEEPFAPILDGNPHLDEVLTIPSQGGGAYLQFLLSLRRRGFTRVVDWLGNPRSAVITWATGAPVRVGIGRSWRRFAYTHRVPVNREGNRYTAAYKLRFLDPLGIQGGDLVLEVALGEEERRAAREALSSWGWEGGRPLVVVSPVSRRSYKRWPLARFAEVGDRLALSREARILILVGPGEEAVGEEVARMMAAPVVLPPEPPALRPLAAVLSWANLFLGNDNGPRHLAEAVGVPTVAVFRCGQGAVWSPPTGPHRAVERLDSGHVDDPDGCQREGCLDRIAVEAVVEAAEELLEEVRAVADPG